MEDGDTIHRLREAVAEQGSGLMLWHMLSLHQKQAYREAKKRDHRLTVSIWYSDKVRGRKDDPQLKERWTIDDLMLKACLYLEVYFELYPDADKEIDMTVIPQEDSSQLEEQRADTGAMAADRMRSRIALAAAKAKRITVWTFRILIGALLMFIVGTGWYAYKTRVVDHLIGYAECSVQVGNNLIKGHRTTFIPYQEILGVRFSLPAEMDAVTRLDLPGNPITVVGINDVKPWSKSADVSERGQIILDSADKYVITTGKAFAVIGYADFCKKKPMPVEDDEPVTVSSRK